MYNFIFIFCRPLEKKVNQLEKELYYYKAKSRKYKDHLKDLPPNDRDENNTREMPEGKGSSDGNHNNRNSNTRETLERKGSDDSNHSNRGINDNEEFHLPTITSHHLLMKKEGPEKKIIDHHNAEDARRLQVSSFVFLFLCFIVCRIISVTYVLHTVHTIHVVDAEV